VWRIAFAARTLSLSFRLDGSGCRNGYSAGAGRAANSASSLDSYVLSSRRPHNAASRLRRSIAAYGGPLPALGALPGGVGDFLRRRPVQRQVRALQYRVEVVGLDLLGRHAADRRLEP